MPNLEARVTALEAALGKRCPVCAGAVESRPGQVYCSVKCRRTAQQRTHRAKAAQRIERGSTK